jgi:1-acyl-sn-glycerol-3-phosphate acyltransferase
VILASNHASHLDPPIVGTGVPRPVVFIAKKELFETPFVGWWMAQLGQIGVERGGGGRQALKVAQKALEDGEAIIIFPEGTRTPSGRMQAGKNGVAVLAVKARVPVVPVGIEGTFEVFRKGRKIPHLGRIIVRYGKPLYFDDAEANEETVNRAKLDEVTARIMLEIQRLLPEKMRPRRGEVPNSQLFSDQNESSCQLGLETRE